MMVREFDGGFWPWRLKSRQGGLIRVCLIFAVPHIFIFYFIRLWSTYFSYN